MLEGIVITGGQVRLLPLAAAMGVDVGVFPITGTTGRYGFGVGDGAQNTLPGEIPTLGLPEPSTETGPCRFEGRQRGVAQVRSVTVKSSCLD